MYALCALLGDAATLTSRLGSDSGIPVIDLAGGQEEFDAAGLGRHHSLEEWLSDA